ncbi:hypothetical protein DL96DRAFT_1720579 [Flagelloscypha sp. PMI_526]|nr:hypothetical protein DL96DRAFT_1720579 [Flagelloscypha sp. PMI_526]
MQNQLQARSSVTRWSILYHATLYPLLHEIATKPHLRPETLETHSESLTKRSKLTTNGLLGIIGFTMASSSTNQLPSEIKVAFTVLI